MKKRLLSIIYKILIRRLINPFLAFNLKPVNLELNKNDKCMVIAPHPDDESIGCGGIISLYPDNFKVVCLTYGSDISLRAKEFNDAMQVAGVKDHLMLDIKDKEILDGFDQFRSVDISQFDYIFVPFICDQHRDHKVVSVLLNKLLVKNNFKKDLKVAFYEVWSAISIPNYFVDITSVAEKKRLMIGKHSSQICIKNYADKILGLNNYRGLLKNLDYAEAFMVLDVRSYKDFISKIVDDI